MPNSEYLRLKALLQNNPEYKQFLDGISKAEGTWNDDPYSTKFGGKKVDWKKGKNRTSNGISNAHGKYQFMNATWDQLASELDLTDFSPEAQDIAALKLLEKQGSLKHIDEGDMEKAIYKASSIWAALPKNSKGDSSLKYKNGAPQKAKSIKKVLSYIESPEKNRAKINDQYKVQNETKAKEYQQAVNYIIKNEADEANYKNQLKKIPKGVNYKSEKKKLDEKYQDILSYERKDKEAKANNLVEKYEHQIAPYWDKIAKIQTRKDLSPEQKNLEKHKVKNEFYDKGLMAVVNVNAVKKQGEFNVFRNKIAAVLKANEDNTVLDSDTGAFNMSYLLRRKPAFDKLIKDSKKFGFTIKPKYEVIPDRITGRKRTNKEINDPRFNEISTEEISKILNSIDTLHKPLEIEPGLLKYGMSREEYDLMYPSVPEESDSSGNSTNTDTSMPDASTSKIDEELKAQKIEQERVRKIEEVEKKKTYDAGEILNSFNQDDEFVGAQFQYKKGKQDIPFDALLSLSSAVAGGIAADDVDIKYRDEQISQGMIAYRNDVGRIKEMGLPPDIEGSLKMKLADAYQTGLTNIVRASNGNRNLVLGNQGQLDQARMTGLVDIAVQDLDRSDKAFAIFGELEQYFNEFDSKRDIANNERRYTEDNLERTAAMTVAQNGMAGFISAIENAKENAPGSMNDYRRQHFQFATTGISPGAKPGEIGSIEYRDAKKAEREILTKTKKDASSWIFSQSLDDQKVIGKLLLENPNLNPLINKNEGTLDTLISEFEKTNGTKDNKDAFNESKGISEIRSSESENTSKEMLGKPKTDFRNTISYNRREIALAQKKYPTLITNEQVPEKTILDQFGKAMNGFQSGVDTINPDRMQQQQDLEEKDMNDLITTQK